MGQTSHWGHLLLSNYSVSPDGYLRLTPNIWTSVGLQKCLNSVLNLVWPRYNLWSLHSCHKGFSVFGVMWHVAATSARWVFCTSLDFWGLLEVTFEGMKNSSLFLIVFLKLELCCSKYFTVTVGPYLQEFLTWPTLWGSFSLKVARRELYPAAVMGC